MTDRRACVDLNQMSPKKRDRSPEKSPTKHKSSKKRKQNLTDDLVNCELDLNGEREYFVNWKGCGVPDPEMISNLELKFDSERRDSLRVTDKTSKVAFFGQNDLNHGNHSQFLVGIRTGDQLVLKPVTFFDMRPQITYKEDLEEDIKLDITTKEKLADLTDKFGSKGSKRMIMNRQKYAVELDDDDLEQLRESEDIVMAANAQVAE